MSRAGLETTQIPLEVLPPILLPSFVSNFFQCASSQLGLIFFSSSIHLSFPHFSLSLSPQHIKSIKPCETCYTDTWSGLFSLCVCVWEMAGRKQSTMASTSDGVTPISPTPQKPNIAYKVSIYHPKLYWYCCHNSSAGMTSTDWLDWLFLTSTCHRVWSAENTGDFVLWF